MFSMSLSILSWDVKKRGLLQRGGGFQQSGDRDSRI